jgi:xanthine dehydrogenase YagR molybdenum-binding subunit
MRDGRWLVGYGMAGITYGHNQADCAARVTIRRDGTASVASGTTEIGVGTWTVGRQLAAQGLGLPLDVVDFELGDTTLPRAPYVGGSGHTAALGGAVHDACRRLLADLLSGVPAGSPLAGCRLDEVVATGGRLVRIDDPARGESYPDLLELRGLDELTAHGESSPPRGEIGVQVKSLIASKHGRVGRAAVGLSRGSVPAGAFGARFVEVAVDPELGIVRVRRVVSAIDAGRVVNEKTARSQIIGGTVQGIGMALLEEVVSDPHSGRPANATFGDYLVPVSADVPDLDVVFVGEPDSASPIGVKGVGEVGFVGVPAAIANAVHHATGRRIRDLPITIEKLL